ncbi:MAG: DUF983 domain-containing protein, partial [Flavobacterium sp.]
KKGSKLYSILTGTCPKCHNESMYLQKNPWHLAQVLKMHENCSHCGLRYQLEPSFFYGAMYVSYGLNVAIGVAAFIVSFFFFKSNLKEAFAAIIIALLVLFPFVLRWARNIYINMFVSYDASQNKK